MRERGREKDGDGKSERERGRKKEWVGGRNSFMLQTGFDGHRVHGEIYVG